MLDLINAVAMKHALGYHQTATAMLAVSYLMTAALMFLKTAPQPVSKITSIIKMFLMEKQFSLASLWQIWCKLIITCIIQFSYVLHHDVAGADPYLLITDSEHIHALSLDGNRVHNIIVTNQSAFVVDYHFRLVKYNYTYLNPLNSTASFSSTEIG